MRTTLDINDALFKQLKQKAELDGRTIGSVVEETIALGLAHHTEKRSPAKPYRVKAHPLKIKPGLGAASFNQVYDQLEAEDAAR